MAQILPFVSLSAAGAAGPGISVDLNGTSNEFTLVTTVTGSPSSVNVNLEGSHDNVNWFGIVSSTSIGSQVVLSTEVTSGQPVGSTPDATYKPHARYVRAHLVSLSGGTSPTVTATVAVGTVV